MGSGFNFLQKLKDHYPDFKCTLFTVPFHYRYYTREMKIAKLEEWAKLVRGIDWIEMAPHGFAHIRGEWLMTNKKLILTSIKAMENLFKRLELNFIKVFKAPHWELSKETEEILNERGYTLAIDRNNPKTFTNIPTYIFNWSTEDKIPSYHTIKGHGHMWDTPNGLNKCYYNLLRIPVDAEFKFISQYLCQNKNTPQT